MNLNPILCNKYGNFGIKDISKCDGWDLVSLDESLVPFINEMEATRAVLAYTHRSQVSPITNGEIPIIATGAEFIIPQLSSQRFIQRASKSGTVTSIKPNEYVNVKYTDNKTEFIDISPRLATTKRASHVNIRLNTLKVGDSFEKNQAIAWSNNFNGDGYSAGRNLIMAIMNYRGFSHED